MKTAGPAARTAHVPSEDWVADHSAPDALLSALNAASDRLTSEFGTWRTPWGEINRLQRLNGAIRQPFNDQAPSLAVPLRVSGVPDGAVLHVDRVVFRVVSSSFKTLYEGRGNAFDVRGGSADVRGASTDGSTRLLRQKLEIPKRSFDRLAKQASDAHIELEYFLTLLRVKTLALSTVADGWTESGGRVTEVGHCASRVDSEGNDVQVACRQVGALPSCLSAQLVMQEGGPSNPEKFECDFSYEPASLQFGTEPMDHFQLKLPFNDPTGAAHFSIGPDQVQDAQVVLRVYEPEGHFTRKVVIAHIPPPA